MKHIFINQHSHSCSCHPSNEGEHQESDADELFGVGYFKDSCTRNPKHTLIYHLASFYIITWHSCLAYSEPEFKQDLVRMLFDEKSECIKKWDWEYDESNPNSNYISSNRIRTCLDDMREYRLRGLQLKEYYNEVNSIYHSYGSTYCILSTVKTKNIPLALQDEDYYQNEYKLCKEYLDAHGMEYLLPELEELNMVNHCYVDKYEAYKFVEAQLKDIRKHIKQIQ